MTAALSTPEQLSHLSPHLTGILATTPSRLRSHSLEYCGRHCRRKPFRIPACPLAALLHSETSVLMCSGHPITKTSGPHSLSMSDFAVPTGTRTLPRQQPPLWTSTTPRTTVWEISGCRRSSAPCASASRPRWATRTTTRSSSGSCSRCTTTTRQDRCTMRTSATCVSSLACSWTTTRCLRSSTCTTPRAQDTWSTTTWPSS
mmetsp:Transcript_37730/g.84080  ORF Transcript_37730/g.84080 Transcript_37730/m.84080 type:complete len:202 (+) Transcript_37730:271-876(+)